MPKTQERTINLFFQFEKNSADVFFFRKEPTEVYLKLLS